MAGCRPILGVDGAHLKGQFPGILLTAVGKDGNNNIYPVAWTVVETENEETWTWFLQLLNEDLNSVASSTSWVEERGQSVTYISDRQKGLLEAFNKVIQQAEIRFCCRHIWANFKIKFAGELFRQHFWSAAKAFNKSTFEQEMNAIKKISVDAFEYLNAIPPKHWSRHAFPNRSKSGMLLNNCCESFNNVLKEARGKPIISLMEWIRRYVMQRSSAKREGLSKFEGVIMPSVLKLIQNNEKSCHGVRVIPVDVFEFEVDDGEESYVVNLTNRTCLCGRWTLIGIPCKHAIACIVLRKLDYTDYVHEAYHVNTYALTYGPKFHGMPGHKMWPNSTCPGPLPPLFRNMPGRPNKRKRRLEVDEARGGKKHGSVVREYKQRKCGNCGSLGHNKKKCKNPPKTTTSKEKSKGGRPRKGSVSSATCTPIMPTASTAPTASTTPPAPLSSTAPLVTTTTASSVAPTNNAASTRVVKKKSWAYGYKKRGAKGPVPMVISTQGSSSSQQHS